MVIKSGLVAACFLAVPFSATGHDDDLRAGNLPPRIGMISPDVAVQRLAQEGIRDLVVLGTADGSLEIEGRVQLRLDRATGKVADVMAPGSILFAPGNFVAPDAVAPIPVDRATVGDPALFQGAVTVIER